MIPKVYLETTVVSFLTARSSGDLVTAAHQQLTRQWWDLCREQYDLLTSQLVVREAGAGDPLAARERLDLLSTIKLLEVGPAALDLANELVVARAVPRQAAEDALHIAIAATHGVDYLLTWNCRHLANATMRIRIEETCRSIGYEPVIICTPEELLEA